MEPFLGQLILGAWGFAPKGFTFCNGALLAINQNQALFSLLGTTFGGNGVNKFGLPDLQGRAPMGYGGAAAPVLGQVGGSESVTLNINQVPSHTHQLQGTTSSANQTRPAGGLLAATSGPSTQLYTGASGLAPMTGATVANYGGGTPHENRQPFLVMNWCIALSGIFPSRN
jgi:microcystin-dependent protein